ncbi:MAG: hypothetical protein GY869_21155, partial [Planctomycetes bacterium]|nr:hypothetical protein [Planctomycetota bacterium]
MPRLTIIFILVVIVLLCNETVQAQSLGSAFTYQGKLSESGSPATGEYDFEFKLFDGEVSVNQQGPTVKKENVAVSTGTFTVELDFGNVFDGDERWLVFSVRAGELADPNVYTLLSPRQEVTPAPYAIHAKTAEGVVGG